MRITIIENGIRCERNPYFRIFYNFDDLKILRDDVKDKTISYREYQQIITLLMKEGRL